MPRKLKRTSKRAPVRRRRRPATRTARTARKVARKVRPVSRRKPKMSDEQLTSMFTRAVRAGSATMARKFAREMRRRSKYGAYDARFARVSADDLRAFEALTKRRRR